MRERHLSRIFKLQANPVCRQMAGLEVLIKVTCQAHFPSLSIVKLLTQTLGVVQLLSLTRVPP